MAPVSPVSYRQSMRAFELRPDPTVSREPAGVAEGNGASRRVLEVNGLRVVGIRGMDERGDTQLLYEKELAGVDVDSVV